MSTHENDIPDLTRDWPADADNDALAQFARRLRQAIPTLPAAALDRVAADVRTELAAQHRRRVRTVLAVLLAAVCAAVLATALWMWLHGGSTHNQPAAPGAVHDSYKLAPGGRENDQSVTQPAVPLERYEKLFTGPSTTPRKGAQ